MGITGKTQVVGLLGWPVSHSFSPQMHNAAARALGLDLVYVPLPVRPGAVAAATRGLAALGLRGANVTIPHKQAVIATLDSVTKAAKAIGAVNTIVVGEAGAARPSRPAADGDAAAALSGANTDWQGFLADLERREVDVAGRECLILGAGGSARAVAYALAQAGGQVSVSARRAEQAQALVAALAPHLTAGAPAVQEWAERAQAGAGALIVNTTPVGMHPRVEESPWPAGAPFPQGAFVYDLIYNPGQTRLMAEAAAGGCRTANGLGMLLYQGALAFALWTGIHPEIEVMAGALP